MADITKAIVTEDGTVTNLIDPTTSQSVNYKPVTVWYDNTPMTNAKCDGRLYRKEGSTYYKQVIDKDGELFLEKDTMAQMRALSTWEILLIKSGVVKGVRLNGYYTEGDTPADIEYYLSDTAAADDGGSVIEVGGVKFKHDFTAEVDIRYYGAKELTDIASLCNSILNKGCSVFIPEGIRYTSSANIEIPADLYVRGVNKSSIVELTSPGYNGFTLNSGSYITGLRIYPTHTTYSAFNLVSLKSTSVENQVVNFGIFNNYLDAKTFYNNVINLGYFYTGNVYDNVVYESGQGHGISIGNNGTDLNCFRNSVYNSGRCGISMYYSNDNINVYSNKVVGFMLRRTLQDGGIDEYGPMNTNVSIRYNLVDTGNISSESTSGHVPIRVSGTDNTKVIGNTIIVNSTSTLCCVQVQNRNMVDRPGEPGYPNNYVPDSTLIDGNTIVLKSATTLDSIFRLLEVKNVTITNSKLIIPNPAGVLVSSLVNVRGNTNGLSLGGNVIYSQNCISSCINIYQGINLSNTTIIGNVFDGFRSRMVQANASSATVIDSITIGNNSYKTSSAYSFYFYNNFNNLIIGDNIFDKPFENRQETTAVFKSANNSNEPLTILDMANSGNIIYTENDANLLPYGRGLIAKTAANLPSSANTGTYWYIETLATRITTTENKIQKAYAYGDTYRDGRMYIRFCMSGVWGNWREVITSTVLASTTVKGVVNQTAASADTATAPSATYTQSEVQAILTELRDLKTKLRTAGILAT